MEKTWKPMVAGILDIVSGIFALIVFVSLIIGSVVTGTGEIAREVPDFVPIVCIIMAIPALAAGILALLGGVCALQRRRWGWALVGSIAAIFSGVITGIGFLLGIPATVFTALAMNEFER